jgi:xylulose-5-phosphate/fructose-6-phosphate phosphoketolase
VIDVIDRASALGAKGAHVRERMKNEIIDNIQYAHENGIDKEEIRNWNWPY